MNENREISALAPRYESIGRGYAQTRREEPVIAAALERALADVRSLVNVGAGAGSYEPRDRHVIAIEPSDVMAAQRGPDRVPAIRCSAESIPLRDQSVDAAMAILSIHHWDENTEQGLREMRRVARGPVLLLTCDTDVSGSMWLMSDYLKEVAELDARTFPSMESISTWLGGRTRVETIPIPRDCRDWMLMSFWAHPERVLDEGARQATSGFARMSTEVIARVVNDVSRDLENGAWDRRHGYLRDLNEFDAGLRLLINESS